MFCFIKKNSLKSITPVVFLLMATFVLSGCGSQNDSVDTDSSGQDDNLQLQLPEAIFANRLDQTAGTLTATIFVNGVEKETVNISGGATEVSFNLANIPTGSTTLTILFTYDLDPYGPLDVARAEKTFTVTQGNNLIEFLVSDYDTTSFDSDGDGISNLVELDENSNTSPVVALCILGTAQLGGCELGS